MKIERVAISTALAKTLAYLSAGKTEKAYEHASVLIELLRDAGLSRLQHRKST